MKSIFKSLKPVLFAGVCFWLFVQGSSCKSPVVPPDDLPPNGPDTTSHDFTWQTDTIGAQGVFYDVAIINDTLAYAVGEIFLRDSTGQIDPQLYNVAVWNGTDWILSRATNVPLRAVFAFAENDIWAGSSAPYHWNGTNWTGYNVTGIFGGNINKIWGSSSSDVYIVGTNGSIAHFNGSSWQKVESGERNPNFRFTDVWGSTKNGSQLVITVGSDFAQDHAVKALTPTLAVDTLGWSSQAPLNTVWFSGDSPF